MLTQEFSGELRPDGRFPQGVFRFQVRFEGEATHAVEARLEGEHLHLSVGGRAWSVLAVGGRGADSSAELVHLLGETFRVELTRGGARAGFAKAGPTARRRQVSAPMPGRVVAVRVAKGDRVSRGDLLFTLEAMKMQNEFVAPVAGRVTQLGAVAGQVARGGEVLVEIEPDGGGG